MSDLVDRGLARVVYEPLARWGLHRFNATGQTPPVSYAAMRRLHGADADRFDRLAAVAQSATRPPEAGTPTAPASGVVIGEVDEIVQCLAADGYAVASTTLSDSVCDELERFARQVDCELVGGDGAAAQRFDEHHPLARRYDISESDLLTNGAVQDLTVDPSLLAVAERYLGGPPVQDLVTAWWSVPHSGPGSSEAAQEFHFDLDRLGFVKTFVYLTEVGPENGPHCFVRGTHRSLPDRFRKPRRYDDQSVRAAFGDAVVELTGRRGTIFFADTRALHKGIPVVAGHRLVFQLEYATSLFGAPYSHAVVDHPTESFARGLAERPEVYRRFLPGGPGSRLRATQGPD